MNVLTLEDLLEVSMFRCKICNRRLQSPVLQVGMFGNICGGVCYERSAFTDVIPNVDVERLLAKLQVPCNYKERGCTYDGSYYKTCKHERGCEFRDKKCPLSYLGTCDDVTEYFHDIPAHISRHHQKHILTGKINSPIDIPNPTKTNPDQFYLLSLDDKKFLLRTWIDSNGLCIFYAFYCFDNDIDLRNVNVSFNMHWENRKFNITDTSVKHVQPDSEIGSTYDTDNAFRMPEGILRSLNCFEKVKISININTKPVAAATEVSNIENQLIESICVHCSSKLKITQRCSNCKMEVCPNCALLNTYCSKPRQKILGRRIYVKEGHVWSSILDQQKFLYDMPGQYAGNDYTHKTNDIFIPENKCSFIEVTCPFRNFAGCGWSGVHKNMVLHIKNTHTKLVNQNNCSVRANQNTDIYFVRDVSVFKQTFNLSIDGNFSITTTMLDEAACNNSYKWEVRVKREDTPMMMIITDMCNADGQQKTINVKNYVTDNKLTLYADIKLADKY